MQYKNDSHSEKRPSLFMQWWDNSNNSQKIKDLAIAGVTAIAIVVLIGLTSFVFADDVYALFSKFFQQELNMKLPENVEQYEALSNVRRNSYLLFFALFASGLAIWARVAQQIQIRQTKEQITQAKKQIDNASVINRNDRFAKAAEMLDDDKSNTSHRGGLYMLRDLVAESPKNEYIRCVEIIAGWLREEVMPKEPPTLRSFQTRVIEDIGEKGVVTRPPDLIEMALYIFSANDIKTLSTEIRETIIEEYKEEYNLQFWPNWQKINCENLKLDDINLSGADLQGANFQSASLQNANLQNVNIQEANFQEAGLQEADLRGAHLQETNLQEAHLPWANLQGVYLGGINLQNAHLREANLQEASLRGAKLQRADLHGVNLQNAHLEEANLYDANLQEANLQKAYMKEVNLELTVLFRTNFKGAFISGKKIKDASQLTKEKVLQTTWKWEGGTGKPPELPDELVEDPEIQEWLKNPPFLYQR